MGKKTSFWVDKQDEELFKDVAFLVEASHEEVFFLWGERWDHPNPKYPHMKLDSWEQINPGRMIQIGEIQKRPICVSIEYNRINGHKVLFYEGCSQLVDHRMIEEWLQHWTLKTIRWDNGHRWAHTNAANFHHCVDAINDLNKKKLKK